MPPLAVPSSFVRTTPVRSTASAKTCAWRRPFWPVVASTDDQRLVRRAREALGGHPAHLRELLHQVRVGVQAPGGVGDHHVGAARLGRRDRVEDDRARVAARRARERSPPRPARPRSRAARSPRRDRCRRRRRRPAAELVVQDRRELADRRRLAGAVDADDHHHRGLGAEVERALARPRRPRRAALPAARAPPPASVSAAALDLALELARRSRRSSARRRRRGSAPPRGAPSLRRRAGRGRSP